MLAGLCGGGCRACFGDDGPVGAGDGVGALDGVGNWFAGCEGAGGSGHDGGCEGCSTGGAASNDRLDGVGDGVAIGAVEALGVFLLGYLLVLFVLGGGAAGEGGEAVGPGQICGVEDIESCVAGELVSVCVVAPDDDDLAVVQIAGMTNAGWRSRLFGGVDVDPGEGRDG